MRSCLLILLTTLTCLSGEPPKPLGPVVDVTLDNGESLHGQLLSFDKGQLSIKTDSGSVTTRDGTKVLTVKFIAPPKPAPPPPTAQETALTESERKRLVDFRFGPRAMQRKSVEEELDFKRLQEKLDVHIDALQREIKSATKEDDALADIADLTRSFLHQGRTPLVSRELTKGTIDEIKDESVKRSVIRHLPSVMKDVFDKVDDRLKMPKKDK